MYRSKHLEDVIQENLKFREKFRLKEELAKLKRHKILDYQQTIKEAYPPKISEDK
jgi:hypothetical protein